MKIIITILFALVFSLHSMAQDQKEEVDQVKRNKKNTIRTNITNPLIIKASNVIIGYERMLWNNQSISVDFGINRFPNFKQRDFVINDHSILTHQKDGKQIGIHATADYRFYLKSENKYHAPRGIYIGPYISHNSFKRTNSWMLNSDDFDGTLTTDLKFTINSVGIQMGYQFVILDRIALDFIMVGPGISNYEIKANLSTNLSPIDETLLYGKINDLLSDKIPGYNLVIDAEEFQKKGTLKTTFLGYRFMVNVGYRF